MSEVSKIEPTKAGRNWWKVGFFVLLVVFEFTREFLVLANDAQANPSSMANIFATRDWVDMDGRWRRIDNGEALVPGGVAVKCNRDQGTCIEATYSIYDKTSVMGPDISVYDATWGPDEVTYENDFPICAKYVTRIDFKLKKAFQVRERKDTAESRKEPHCKILEPRIETQLGDGYEFNDNLFNANKHFVPFLSVIMSLFQ